MKKKTKKKSVKSKVHKAKKVHHKKKTTKQEVLKPFTIKERVPMKKKSHSTKSKKAHVKHVVRYYGDPGRGRKGKLFSGEKVVHGLSHAGLGLVGAAGGSAIAKVVPIPTKMQPAIPLLLGMVLLAINNNIVRSIGIGMGIMGGYGLVKSVVPGIPLLGEESKIVLTSDAARMLGIPFEGDRRPKQEMMGIPFAGDLEHKTGMDM